MRQASTTLALAWFLTVASLITSAFGPPVITDGKYPPLRLYPEHVQAARRLSVSPRISAVSALIADLDSGQILYALRPHDRVPPASTVKLMTALLALQRTRLTDQVTVSATAAATEGSRMELVAGEVLTVRDLLYGLLLPSGNDAAVALAEYVSGSQEAFVALMNETAATLGMVETHFANPHGFDDADQHTSAADLLKLTKADLSFPVFAEIVAKDSAYVAGRSLVNTNQLLSLYRGADGIKTGTTAAAGECLVASVTRGGHRVIVIILGSQDRYGDATVLLDYAAATWRWQILALPADALAWAIGPDGQVYRLRAAERLDVFLPAWEWTLAGLVRVLEPTVPLTATMPVGTLTLKLGDQVLGTVPLIVWQEP